jgi:hypothetical protein
VAGAAGYFKIINPSNGKPVSFFDTSSTELDAKLYGWVRFSPQHLNLSKLAHNVADFIKPVIMCPGCLEKFEFGGEVKNSGSR